MPNPLRDAFLTRLRSRVYIYLKSHRMFSDWNTAELYQVSEGIVRENKERINEYLNQHEFTVADSEKAADNIMQKFLIPEIEKLRI